MDDSVNIRMECLKLAVMRTSNAEPLKAIGLAREYESYVLCGLGTRGLTGMATVGAHVETSIDPAVTHGTTGLAFEPFTPPAPPSQSPT